MKQSIVLVLGLALLGTASARDTAQTPAPREADREVLTRIVVDTWASHVDEAHQQRWLGSVQARAESVPLAWLETAAAALDLRSAELALEGAAPLDTPTPAAFGDVGGNLVFTPITPCRLLDTRQPSPRSGTIPAYGEREFYAYGFNFEHRQGGAYGHCGLPEEVLPEALAITLAAVNPSSDGYLTAYPVGSEQPLAASLNYIGGQVTATGLILSINNAPLEPDFVVYSRRETHVVADVTGYFSRPEAAALECMTIQGGPKDMPPYGAMFTSSPMCPYSYTAMVGTCTANSVSAVLNQNDLAGGMTTCLYSNTGGSMVSIRANAHCCRTPGR